MGFFVKPKSTEIYGALLHMYPQSFRGHYGPTMKQTFDDMLEGERTKAGQLRLWARTLLDLPLSAGKEHLTNGKDSTMNRNFKLLLIAAVAGVLIVGAGSFWFGKLHAWRSVGIERVGVAQLADAMQQDNFYSSYGSSVVLFNAKVTVVKHGQTATLVTFETNRPYSVTCQFPNNVPVSSGKTISVAAPAGSAERQKSGVLLHNCLIN
jgi:hypothetical protein